MNTAEAAIDAAVAGIGVTRVLSYQVAVAERDGRLVRTLRSFEPSPMPVSLVYTGQPLLPLKLRMFLDFATPSPQGPVVRVRLTRYCQGLVSPRPRSMR